VRTMRLLLRRDPPEAIAISRSQVEALEALATSALPNEAGGILLGWRMSGCIHVYKALEVPDRAAGRASYLRKHDVAEAVLQAELIHVAGNPAVGYVGEWHSHPAALPPSSQDERELRDIARLAGGAVTMIVVVRGAGACWQLYVHNALGRRIERARVNMEEEGNEPGL